MKKLLLERFLSCEHGVFGTLDFASEHDPQLFTCEDEWRDNQPKISCIPVGVYPLRLRFSPKFQRDMYEVCNVPDRAGILIHPGNTEENTEGCILVGLNLGVVRVATDEESGRPNKKTAVVKSKAAFDAFLQAMDGDEGELSVTWAETPGASA